VYLNKILDKNAPCIVYERQVIERVGFFNGRISGLLSGSIWAGGSEGVKLGSWCNNCAGSFAGILVGVVSKVHARYPHIWILPNTKEMCQNCFISQVQNRSL